MTSDFLDDEQRRRLAYADRSETLEVREAEEREAANDRQREMLREYHAAYEDWKAGFGARPDWPLIDTHHAPADAFTPPNLADGTGRHSRKELEQATHGDSCICDSCYRRRFDESFRASHSVVVAGVSFTSVPQLCAAYEYALEMLRRMYKLTDPKQHAWQMEQDTMREAKALLLAAGKDVT